MLMYAPRPLPACCPQLCSACSSAPLPQHQLAFTCRARECHAAGGCLPGVDRGPQVQAHAGAPAAVCVPRPAGPGLCSSPALPGHHVRAAAHPAGERPCLAALGSTVLCSCQQLDWAIDKAATPAQAALASWLQSPGPVAAKNLESEALVLCRGSRYPWRACWWTAWQLSWTQ